MNKKRISYIITLSLLVAFSSWGASPWKGPCVGISDGDTISVMKGTTVVKIRLHGVDCPESSQAFGSEATKFTEDLCLRTMVTVVETDTDKYGRTVAIVLLPEKRILNHELVVAGLAWWYEQYAPKDKALQILHTDAKSNKRGLWADPNPIPPWEFRHTHAGSSSALEAGELPPTTIYTPKTPSTVNDSIYQPIAPKASPQTSSRPKTLVIPPKSGSRPSTGYSTPNPRPTYKSRPRPTPNATTSPTVYTTNTGKKYHSSGCQYLAKSKIPISLQSAKGRGLTPCSRCGPPR